jgi:hypothetical protein
LRGCRHRSGDFKNRSKPFKKEKARKLERLAKIEKILALTESPNAGEAQAAKNMLRKFHHSTVARVRRMLEARKQAEEARERVRLWMLRRQEQMLRNFANRIK